MWGQPPSAVRRPKGDYFYTTTTMRGVPFPRLSLVISDLSSRCGDKDGRSRGRTAEGGCLHKILQLSLRLVAGSQRHIRIRMRRVGHLVGDVFLNKIPVGAQNHFLDIKLAFVASIVDAHGQLVLVEPKITTSASGMS